MAESSTVEPAGFGNCGSCPLFQTGTAQVCSACAFRSFDSLPADRCLICDGSLDEKGNCRNRLCNWQIGERQFAFVWAVSNNTGPLRDAIHRYKYRGKWGWGIVFGRVLAGYLDTNHDIFRDYDFIIPSPTYVGAGGRYTDHIADIVRVLESESEIEWPIAYDIITKTAATPKMADTTSWHQRLHIAQTRLRPALYVAHPDDLKGKRVLVIDDVFTAGHTLMEVARALRRAGATEVSQIVLARQTWA